MLSTSLQAPCRRVGAWVMLLALCAGIDTAHAQVLSTPNTLYRIAGGSSGTNDGTGPNAQFSVAYGITSGTDGNLYVADTSNNTIRKITPAGVVTTIAGMAGTCGSADGTGTAARFCTPFGITSDTAGNLYVADTSNGTIRKITSAGVVSTIAGMAGTCGSADGTGTAAQFCAPAGITSDADGNLYVADTSNNTIRKITPAGVVTTIAGMAGPCGSVDGTGTAARFCDPWGITSDTTGNLYVADTGNGTIRKITSAGVVSTIAGMAGTCSSADGTGTAARFCIPFGITSDTAGNLYVADTGNDTLRKVTPAGVVSTVAGIAGNPGPGSYPMALPGMMNPFSVAVIGINQLAIGDRNYQVLGANLGSAAYAFSGFLQPVDNPPVFNRVKAGSAVPVKFSLGGDQGLAIFEQGYPAAQPLACSNNAPIDAIEETVTAGGSSLSYDATVDQYVYVWKTDKAWAGTCRQLTLRLTDGTDHKAVFQLTK